ncbi:MAG TPA: hypothetical protein VFQ53_08760 [Kofleriaceae bacterium]|nr:hypothetical protein [Kofleriaceae bacterium]
MMRTCYVLVAALAACGGSDANNPTPDGGSDSSPDAGSGCPRAPAADDRTRYVVVSHPYDTAGQGADTFEVLELSAAGELTRPTPNRIFSLARTSFGQIAFTPDGKIGLVATEDGKLAVFELDAAGMPRVIDAGLAGSFYATRIYVDPRGDRAYVLDGNTRENGGGIYRVDINCDGTVVDRGLVAAAKLPGGMALAGNRAIVAAGDILTGAKAGDDVQLLDWSDTPSLVGGVDAFGDDMAIVGGSALTTDGMHYLVGDTSAFGDQPNRVEIVDITGTTMTSAGQVLVEDPQAIAASPFGTKAIVTSALGDKIFVLAPGATGTWAATEVSYAGGRPQLPGDLAAIDRGTLRGHVFISENVSIRHLAFTPDGNVTDLGSLAFGMGLENIGGAIGITP